MPWSVEDVDSKVKGLTDKQKKQWVAIANSTRDECISDGGDEKTCDAKAIRIANGTVKKVKESDEMSMDDIRQAIQGALNPAKDSDNWVYVDSLWDDAAVYSKGNKYYKVSYVIDDKGDVTLGTPVEVVRKTNYEPVESKRWVNVVSKNKSKILDSAGTILFEEAKGATNVFPIKIIQPGWGSSGYYPKAILERDGPKVFKAGIQSYWDHPRLSDESDRPERSLRDLAGVLTSDAEWKEDGLNGAGLYSSIKVFDPYVSAVRELAPHIGVSIRASGVANEGEADGENGMIIEEITNAASVDFVTMPGAGGKVLQLFEAARNVDLDERNKKMAELNELQEANAELTKKNDELTASAEVTQKELDAAKDILTKQKEAAIISRATAYVQKALADAKLPEPAQKKMLERLVAARELTAEGELDEAKLAAVVESTVADEKAYIESLVPEGGIKGMGDSSKDEKPESINESMKRLYKAQGINEEMANKMAEIGE